MKYITDEKDIQKCFEPMNRKTRHSTESKKPDKSLTKKTWQRNDHKRKIWSEID